jgi:hypothetical protein
MSKAHSHQLRTQWETLRSVRLMGLLLGYLTCHSDMYQKELVLLEVASIGLDT